MKQKLVLACFLLAILVPSTQAQRKLAPGQVARLMTLGFDGADPRVVHETTDLIEAPNWSSDGKWLVYNSQGALWRIAADGGSKPEKIPTDGVQGANNDHVLSPDGRTIYFSAGFTTFPSTSVRR